MSPLPVLRHLARDRAGQVAVESAFLLPVLLLALLGVMETGRMAWTKATLNYAVQEAARCGAVRPDICAAAADIQAFAAQKASVLKIPASAFVVTTPACGVQVAADVTHGFILYKLVPSAPHITARVCRA